MKSSQLVLLVALVCLAIVLMYSMGWLRCIGLRESFGGNKGYFQIDWKAPTSSGSSDLDFYTVIVKNSNGVEAFKKTVQAPATTVNLGDGDDFNSGEWNEEYTISITATNKDGEEGPAATKTFNSGANPTEPTSVTYAALKPPNFTPSPITTKTTTDSRFRVSAMVASKDTGKFSGSLQIFRKGTKICEPSFAGYTSTGKEGDMYLMEADFLSCADGFTGFQAGDVVKVTFTNYINIRGDTVSWSDPVGYTVPSDGPSPPSEVQNITAKFVYVN